MDAATNFNKEGVNELALSVPELNVDFVDDRLSSTPYYKLYGLNPANYSNVKVNSLDFSVRLGKRVREYGTLEKLLAANDDTLCKIKGFGKGCLEELHAYLGTLAANRTLTDYSNAYQADVCSSSITIELMPYKDQILRGEFDFLNSMTISAESTELIEKFKAAHEVLDSELVEALYEKKSEVLEIREMLQTFIERTNNSQIVEDVIKEIPLNRLNEHVSWVVKCFTSNQEALNYLSELISDKNQTLQAYLKENAERIISGNRWFKRLTKWCQYDLDTDFDYFFVKQLKSERELQIISQRAERKTLDEIGKSMDITRERVRQIESKVRERFDRWQKRQRIMFKIFLDMGEENGLSPIEVINHLGVFGREFIYLMKGCETEQIHYDKQLDMFVVENLSLTESVQAYVDALPDTFPEKKLGEYLKIATEENEYPEKMVVAVIEDNYKKTGDTYHRFRLTLASVYGAIMQKYYPNGIHIYDADAIESFRRHVEEDYCIDISDKGDHAISSILSRIGILCDRGVYKYCQNAPYISKSLAKRIHDFIEESDTPIFMTNTLFSVFEEDLIAEGIDNKYFLQGILRELFGDEWIFRRDYISKDEAYTSVYSSIVGFIKNSQHPVSKEDLLRKFPGVTDIVISLSVSDPNILNLFGLYIHSCHLVLSDADIEYLKKTVERFLENKKVCHCREIYEYINADYPVLLTNNYVQYPFSLFSLLEYLFRERYNFSRPYIAQENATIERVLDVLRDIVKESERLDISEIQAFAREHGAQIYSIREFIDSCNDTHFLISDLEVASIKYIGITEQMARDIETKIVDEIDTTVPIHQLHCIHSLPSINVEWNAWLIYSALKKWGTQVEVAASASQFRQAYPIVAPLGKLDVTALEESTGKHAEKIIVADNLNEIDDLIGDFSLDDLEGIQ